MATRAVLLVVGVGLLASFSASAGDSSHKDAAKRAEAILKKGRERLRERRDGAKPAQKRNPMEETIEDVRARAESLIAAYEKTGDPKQAVYQPGAHTVMGRYHWVIAGEQVSKGRLDEARKAWESAHRHYLVVLKEYPQRKAYQEEALYFAGLCCSKLEGHLTDARELAVCYWRELVRSYKGGTFARQAMQDLKRSGYRF